MMCDTRTFSFMPIIVSYLAWQPHVTLEWVGCHESREEFTVSQAEGHWVDLHIMVDIPSGESYLPLSWAPVIYVLE